MSDMQIEIVANPVNTVPTAKGSYQVIELAYKNKSFQDKLEGKKIMSFTNKEVFNALKESKFGDIFNVTRVKNDKGFWDWTAVRGGSMADSASNSVGTNDVPATSNFVSSNMTSAATSGYVKGTPSPKSTYETTEERAARQVLIVRQSSISSAVEFAAANKIKDEEEVIRLAKRFEAFVFGKEVTTYQTGQSEVLEPPKNFFEDMADDLP
jgi:hypothetical protein